MLFRSGKSVEKATLGAFVVLEVVPILFISFSKMGMFGIFCNFSFVEQDLCFFKLKLSILELAIASNDLDVDFQIK